MLLAQLEAFSEVARLGNVSRAADTLSVTQPALTADGRAVAATRIPGLPASTLVHPRY